MMSSSVLDGYERASIMIKFKEQKEIAQKAALESGFDYVEYIGTRDNKSVYMAALDGQKTNPRPTGLPCIILIDPDNGDVRVDYTLDYMDMVKE